MTTAEVAGMWVKNWVGANIERSPMQLDTTEGRYFQVYSKNGENDYRYGAEIEDAGIGSSRQLQDY